MTGILAAATKAPSGSNKQNWEFIIVDDPERIEKVGRIKYILNRGEPQGEQVSDELKKAALRRKNPDRENSDLGEAGFTEIGFRTVE